MIKSRTLFSASLFISVLLLVGGCSKGAPELFAQAKEQAEQGKVAEAILSLKGALQLEADNGAMRGMLGASLQCNLCWRIG